MSLHWNVQADQVAHAVDFVGHEGRSASRQIRLRQIEIDGVYHDVLIRLVENTDEISLASELINERYVRKGYGDGHKIPTSINHATFTAEVDGEVVATITLAVDSPRGLAADRTFKDELDSYRDGEDAVVCELTKFAFRSHVHSKRLMAALFHVVFVYGQRTYGGTDLFIEVHPKHVRFYQAMLGFERVGPMKVNESVGASLQLMALKVAEIREKINRVSEPGCLAAAHSLYPLFFSPREEDGIYARLSEAEIHAS